MTAQRSALASKNALRAGFAALRAGFAALRAHFMKPHTCQNCGSRHLTAQQPIHGYIVTTYEPDGPERLRSTSREVTSCRNYRQPMILKCTDCLTEIRTTEEALATFAE